MDFSPAEQSPASAEGRGSSGFRLGAILLVMGVLLGIGWLSLRREAKPRPLSAEDRRAAAALCAEAAHLASASRTLEDVNASIDLLNDCVTLYPAWPEAYLLLAKLHRESADRIKLPREVMPQASAAIESLLRFEVRHPAAHAELALYKMFYESDWTGAEAEFKTALDGSSPDPLVRASYARFLQLRGRLGEARIQLEHALESEPASSHAVVLYGRQLMLEGRPEEAQALLRRASDRTPRDPEMRYAAASVLSECGENLAALELLRGGNISTNEIEFLGWSGFFLARLGRTNEAQAQLQQLGRLSRTRYVSPLYPAIICLGLHREREAFRHLGNAYTYRSSFMLGLKIDYPLKELAAEPYVADLGRRMGL